MLSQKPHCKICKAFCHQTHYDELLNLQKCRASRIINLIPLDLLPQNSAGSTHFHKTLEKAECPNGSIKTLMPICTHPNNITPKIFKVTWWPFYLVFLTFTEKISSHFHLRRLNGVIFYCKKKFISCLLFSNVFSGF